ncbi:MAG: hypothetical protein JO368_00990 [Acidimicrobiales bacterium]|nr:hypothetical protein [Acidimicrobiales bacterium]
MTTAQTQYTADELLADHDYVEPLVVGGVRCHGGFVADGSYASPRTKNRWPAIHVWEEERQAAFGTPVLDIPLETWPENFPNVEQTKFLLKAGVRQPTVSALTRIGTVEGFGGLLRQVPIPDLPRSFDEDISGTAIDHIDRGLFEAHARDEAGHGDQAGHDRMWFIARDIAFENPVTEDETARMLERMGIANGRRGPVAAAPRALPGDIDPDLEVLASRMIGLLLIEISAFHGFLWAEAVLADRDLVAGDGEAAVLVSRIRADETPHVAWLRTALSEMRDRTWVGKSGRHYAGSDMIARLWDRALGDSLGVRRRDNLSFIMGEIERDLEGRPDAADVMSEMLSLGTVSRAPDGSLVDAPLRPDSGQ